VRNWFTKVLQRTSQPAPERPPAARISTRVADSPPQPPEAPTIRPPAKVSADQIEFLEGLIDPPAPRSLARVSKDDRLFLGGIQRRWHARRLDLPVIPAAALRLAEMLRSPDAPLAPLVELIESDASLSVEVLKSANSAMFAHGPTVRSIHDAILRIGLRRLGSLLLMAQLTSKVMKGGDAQNKAALLVEMVPPLGRVAGLLASAGEVEDSQSFIRGTLLHVEHMVIIGAIADVSRDHKQPVKPSVLALHEAFGRFGPEIRHAVATAWNLQSMLLVGPDVEQEYAGFRKAIVLRWLGQPLPALHGIERSQLEVVMSQIHPRV
jgi:HD-like signal output (HDOD) protein